MEMVAVISMITAKLASCLIIDDHFAIYGYSIFEKCVNVISLEKHDVLFHDVGEDKIQIIIIFIFNFHNYFQCIFFTIGIYILLKFEIHIFNTFLKKNFKWLKLRVCIQYQ